MSSSRNRPEKTLKSPSPSNPNQPGSSNPNNNPKELHSNGGPTNAQRVMYSQYDVVLIMEGMLNFIAQYGVDSTTTTTTTSVDAFVDFLNNRRTKTKNKDDDSRSYSAENVVRKISFLLEKVGSDENNYVLHLQAHNVGSEKELNLGKNDGRSSEKEESFVGQKKVLELELESMDNGGEKNASVGVSKSKSRARGRRKKAGLGKCDVGVTSAKGKEKIDVVEKKVNCVNNVEGINSNQVSKSMEKKSGVSGKKLKLKTFVGEKKVCVGSKENKRGEAKSTENVGGSKSKFRGRVSKGKGKRKTTTIQLVDKKPIHNRKVDDKKSGLGKFDVGFSCSSAKEKINVVEKKVTCVNNVDKSTKKKSSVSGEKTNKGTTNSVTVKRLRLRLRRKRKTTAIVHMGKKSISKTKKNGGMKQKKNDQIREAWKGEVKKNNFGLLNENETIASEAMRRMISRWVNITNELQTDISWCPPKMGVLKWNTDASLREEDGTSAIGGVLRDWNGSYRCIFSCPVDCIDSNEVELRAIYKALELASCKDWLLSIKMVIESDSMNAVKWCNEDAGGPLNLGYMLGFIRECRMWLPGLEIRYMGRKSNSVADRLAKQGHQRTKDFVAWM